MTLGLTLLVQTILITFITGLINLNFWFSYLIFLIIIGGILILFIYITRIASNEKFKISKNYLFIILNLPILIIIFTDKLYYNLNITNIELINQNNFYSTYLTILSKYFNWPLNINFIIIIMYLLITLIAVVKITNIQHGPLRQSN